MTQEELQSITLEKGDDSTVTLKGEIPFSYLAKHREAAIKFIGKDMEIDGFRKGHVPEKTLIEKVGEMTILSEMAERALRNAYPEMVKEKGLEVIGYPQINITKLAADNPLGFSITVAVMPEIALPDYKKIAADINKEKESKEVTDEEVDKQIEDIMRQKMAYERLQAKAQKNAEQTQKNAEKDSSGTTILPTPDTIGKSDKPTTLSDSNEPETEAGKHVHDEHCNHDHDEPITDEEEFKKLPLPELTDEYVKALGQPGQFTSVEDFKAKLREHLAVEKERDVVSRHRAKITDAITEKTTLTVPQVMIEAEINQMFAQMEEDLNRAQLKFEDYLGHIKKTREDLKNEWKPSAEKRAKLQLVINEIIKKEDITADQSLVDHEVSHMLEQYKDADEARVRVYIESVLANEAVLKMLEGCS